MACGEDDRGIGLGGGDRRPTFRGALLVSVLLTSGGWFVGATAAILVISLARWPHQGNTLNLVPVAIITLLISLTVQYAGAWAYVRDDHCQKAEIMKIDRDENITLVQCDGSDFWA